MGDDGGWFMIFLHGFIACLSHIMPHYWWIVWCTCDGGGPSGSPLPTLTPQKLRTHPSHLPSGLRSPTIPMWPMCCDMSICFCWHAGFYMVLSIICLIHGLQHKHMFIYVFFTIPALHYLTCGLMTIFPKRWRNIELHPHWSESGVIPYIHHGRVHLKKSGKGFMKKNLKNTINHYI